MAIAFIKGAGLMRVPTGFSWTTLLFGSAPSLLRRHFRFLWVVFAADFIGLFVSLFVLNGTDAFLSILFGRVLVSSIRNACLHFHLIKRGWIVGPSAQVVQFPANDNQFGDST